MRIVVFIAVFFSLQSMLFAQGSLRGSITDRGNNTALSDVIIAIDDGKQHVNSSIDGAFSFDNITIGIHKFHIWYFGYADTTVSINILDKTSATLNVSLTPLFILMPSVLVTATRNARKPEELAQKVEVISEGRMKEQTASNVVDYLSIVPGINVNRDWGIYSKNSSITMRGLNSAQRVLILLNGIPMNKMDGGSINWNRINLYNVDHIEVLKGPVSPLYGGNAMAGVVNVLYKKPIKPLEAVIGGFYGTYNTLGGNAQLSSTLVKNDKGFYGSISQYYRKGKGYVVAPDSIRTSRDTATYLWETNTNGMLAYRFSKNTFCEAEYCFYDDKRGDGVHIYEPEGGYNRYTTNSMRLMFQSVLGKVNMMVNGYYQLEHYQRQSETMSVKNNKKYTLYHTDANRIDKGVWISFFRDMDQKHYLNAGLDMKQGNVDASDIYYTSTDIMMNKGTMNMMAPYFDYTYTTFKGKLKINPTIRFDFVSFDHGSFAIKTPSGLTDFMNMYPSDFRDTSWFSASPKLAVRYNYSKNINFYINISKGFRPPMLDDMCKNGNVGKGFKVANPALKPETIINYEIGSTLFLMANLQLNTTLYYSLGKDFQYFIGNGDSVYTGGDKLKAVLIRENIGKVTIYGAEASINYIINKHWSVFANYAYSHSIISSFNTTQFVGKDLTGKFIMEVPLHQAYTSLLWKNKFFNSSVNARYLGKEWADDENTYQTDPSFLFDLKISRSFKDRLLTSFSIHDLLNARPVDGKGMLSPGRFLMLEMNYKITK